MIIQIDTREKQKAIKNIKSEFDRQGITYFESKLFVGDYMNVDNPRLCVDRKKDLFELCVNVCQDHKRFAAELQRASQMGFRIIILCEHGQGIKSLDDVKCWKNPRLKTSPLAVSGERLHKILATMKTTYNFDIQFCDKKQTGAKIIDLLRCNDA